MQNNIGHFPPTSNQSGFKASKVLNGGCPKTTQTSHIYDFFERQSLKHSFSGLYKLTFLKLGTLIP